MLARVIVLALLTALCSAGASISYTGTLINTQSGQETIDTILFPDFNPALGTLTSLDFGITATESTYFQYVDNFAVPPNQPFELFAQVTANVMFQIGSNQENVANGQIQDLGQRVYIFNNIGPFTAGTNPVPVTGDVSLSDPATLASFTGAGGTMSIPFTLYATAVSISPAASSLAVQFATNGSASVTLTYDYNPPAGVPEPGSLGLVGTGALLLFPILRRSRRKLSRF
jgi:hypothetical protein